MRSESSGDVRRFYPDDFQTRTAREINKRLNNTSLDYSVFHKMSRQDIATFGIRAAFYETIQPYTPRTPFTSEIRLENGSVLSYVQAGRATESVMALSALKKLRTCEEVFQKNGTKLEDIQRFMEQGTEKTHKAFIETLITDFPTVMMIWLEMRHPELNDRKRERKKIRGEIEEAVKQSGDFIHTKKLEKAHILKLEDSVYNSVVARFFPYFDTMVKNEVLPKIQREAGYKEAAQRKAGRIRLDRN